MRGKEQATWGAWFAFLRILFALPLEPGDAEVFRQCTGRNDVPTGGFTQSYLICGRRSGKSRMLAMVAVFLAVFRDWSPYLSPGERGTVMILSADRKQSRTIFAYAAAFLKALDVDTVTVERETMDTLELGNGTGNGIIIEIGTANFRTVRGYTIVAALLDEASFWNDAGANPDQEILTALKPAMATVPGSIMMVASSPYRKSGILYDGWRKHFAKDGDPVLCWVAGTRTINPSVPEDFIAAEIEKDPEAARSEYVTDPSSPFRDDISTFVAAEVIDAATIKGRSVIAPSPDVSYTAFLDLSGGRSDSHVVSCAFQDMSGAATLACVREVKSADVEAVAAEFSALLMSYGLREAFADEYAAEWPRSAFRRHGITIHKSPFNRSELYLNALPMLSSGRAKLLDLPRLRQQLLALERRTSKTTARDIVDHPQSSSHADDVANSACGALVMVARAAAYYTPISVAAVGPHGSMSMTIGSDGKAIYDRSDDFDHTADWRPKETPWDNSASLGRLRELL